MLNTVRFSILTFLFFISTSCAPKNNTKKEPTQLTPPSVEDLSYTEDAINTLSDLSKKLEESPNTKYQAPPKKIINNDKTELIVGEAKLNNTKVSYKADTGVLEVTGEVIILNDQKVKLAEKKFQLVGLKNQDDLIIKLIDENDVNNPQTRVRAQAICVNAEPSSLDCNHVVIDIFISHNKKIYTEQIEVNRAASIAPPIVNPPQNVPPTGNSSETTTPPSTANEENENADQSAQQQSEASDESINGRYQGTAQTADLTDLFSEPSQDKTKSPPKKSDKKDVVLGPDVILTKSGDVRQVNQSVGFVDSGKLRNATSLLAKQQTLNSLKKDFFEVVVPDRKRYYGTYEMAETILRIGELLNEKYSKKLFVSNISAKNGGKLSPHASHQTGLDADLAYPTDLEKIKFPLVVKMSNSDFFPKNYSAEKTYEVFKFLFSQKDISVDRIFVDQKIKDDLCRIASERKDLEGESKDLISYMFENIQHVSGHGDHFHLRLKCSKLDPACRGRIYKKLPICQPQKKSV